MLEIQVINQANELLSFYEDKYREKYKTLPILDRSRSDYTFLKDLIRVHGLNMAKQLIEQFFLSQNVWFKTKAHSLDVLRNNLNTVNVELASHQSYGGKVNLKLAAAQKINCDACWKYFYAKFNPNIDWDKTWVRCPECEASNTPFKYPNQIDFESAYPLKSYDHVFINKEKYPAHMTLLRYQVEH